VAWASVGLPVRVAPVTTEITEFVVDLADVAVFQALFTGE